MDVLPWRDHENDTKRRALDEATETRLVGVFESDVRKGLLRDIEHVLCAFKCSPDFPWALRNGAIDAISIYPMSRRAHDTHRPICRVSSSGISSRILPNSSCLSAQPGVPKHTDVRTMNLLPISMRCLSGTRAHFSCAAAAYWMLRSSWVSEGYVRITRGC